MALITLTFNRTELTPPIEFTTCSSRKPRSLVCISRLRFAISSRKTCPSVCQLKSARLASKSSRKRALFVAEQLTFNKRWRNSAAVHPDKGLIPPVTQLMEDESHNAFARTRFALDQYRQIRLCNTPQFGSYLPCSLTVPENCFHRKTLAQLLLDRERKKAAIDYPAGPSLRARVSIFPSFSLIPINS